MNIEKQEPMNEISVIREQINELKEKLGSNNIHQFTIDYFEELDEDLMSQECNERSIDNATFFGAESYRICNILEVIDKETEDKILFEKLLDIIEKGRKL